MPRSKADQRQQATTGACVGSKLSGQPSGSFGARTRRSISEKALLCSKLLLARLPLQPCI
jgi:hypothetical protein